MTWSRPSKRNVRSLRAPSPLARPRRPCRLIRRRKLLRPLGRLLRPHCRSLPCRQCLPSRWPRRRSPQRRRLRLRRP
ncbi:MAG: hypothetical protein C0483_03230 [Pirellula sp.]|nr:hypothetical protein [Pirellula sp.]